MDRIRIRGGQPLQGTISIGGAKNAALPLMAATLLTEDMLTLDNLPHVADIATMTELLVQLGVSVHMNGGYGRTEDGNGSAEGRMLGLSAADLINHTAPYDLVRKMRASVLVLGPLLTRLRRARVSLPGGCAIGPRPVDLHLKGLQQMGAEITLNDGYIDASAPRGLTGAHIALPSVSVGATENLMMAAVLADGVTTIANAAREPEVQDLANCLVAMGGQITGIGSDTLEITGVPRLTGAQYRVLPDRIETGTYAIAAAVTNGDVELLNTDLDLIDAVAEKLTDAGIRLTPTARGFRVRRDHPRIRGIDLITQPFPGFPTDMQAQMMVLLTVADGASLITETIFENRYMHVPELTRMGANITVHGASAMVRGTDKLTGAQVMATDLRASVSLVLAGLAADDETVINRVYHLDRGYERVEEKLAGCGADIERLVG